MWRFAWATFRGNMTHHVSSPISAEDYVLQLGLPSFGRGVVDRKIHFPAAIALSVDEGPLVLDARRVRYSALHATVPQHA